MRKILAILTVIFCCTCTVLAQDTYVATPVTISKEKVKFGGKTYYSHVVLEKQTLYSICKAYGVTLEEVYECNADLHLETAGLKKNSILRIPIHDSKNNPKPAETQTAPEEAKTETVTAVVPEEKTTIHVVKWYEDLEGIAAKYGVSKEAIMKANNLEDEKLKARTKLVIPAASSLPQVEEPDATPEITEAPDTTEVRDTTFIADLPEDVEPADTVTGPRPKSELRFALILPLDASSNKVKSNYMDMYCGALLAARDAKERGINLNLTVFDEACDMSKMDSTTFENMDAIIGPVGADNMSQVLGLAESCLTIVSPLDPKTGELTAGFSQLYHTNPSTKGQYADLVSWIAEEKRPTDRIIVISQKGKADIKDEFAENLNAQGLAATFFEYDILDGRRIGGTLSTLMTREGTNRILLASDSEAFIIDATRNLRTLQKRKLDIQTYGPAKFKRFETIEIESFHILNLHMSLSTNVNYNDGRVKNFLMKYRALFGTEPKEHAFCGYDVVSYFAELISQYGEEWQNYVDTTRLDLLQTGFEFHKVSEEGGYVNEAFRRVVYTPDYKLEIVR